MELVETELPGRREHVEHVGCVQGFDPVDAQQTHSGEGSTPKIAPEGVGDQLVFRRAFGQRNPLPDRAEPAALPAVGRNRKIESRDAANMVHRSATRYWNQHRLGFEFSDRRLDTF